MTRCDLSLGCATRGSLCFAYAWDGQLRQSEAVADQVIGLACGNPHLGSELVGFSPLLAARLVRLRCIGCLGSLAIASQEIPSVLNAAFNDGYPEQALWGLSFAAEFESVIDRPGRTHALEQAAERVAENLGAGNQILAAFGLCEALAHAREWESLLKAASNALRLIRERGAMSPLKPSFLAHIGIAHIELGDLEAGRLAAQEGLVFMRESKGAWSPRSYAVIARAQLELSAPAANIARTLDEYAALLERTEFRLFEGELHELRARLASREGRHVESAAALKRAYDCYTNFGMGQETTRMANPRTVR